MSEATEKPAIKLQFMGIAADRLIPSLIVTAFIGTILAGYVEYFRELRIANEIEALGGVAKSYNHYSALPELWPYARIRTVSLVTINVTSKTVSDLGSLSCLQSLSLSGTEVTDADLEHLRRLSSLRELYLNGTMTTAQGRAKLRYVLPYCRIYPDP